MYKRITLVLALALPILGQNIQLHYEASEDRQYPVTTLEMFKPDDYGSTFWFVDMEYDKSRYWIRTERVNYDDKSPWPTTPDGEGMSLSLKTPDTPGANYSNDVENWQATSPNPGY